MFSKEWLWRFFKHWSKRLNLWSFWPKLNETSTPFQNATLRYACIWKQRLKYRHLTNSGTSLIGWLILIHLCQTVLQIPYNTPVWYFIVVSIQLTMTHFETKLSDYLMIMDFLSCIEWCMHCLLLCICQNCVHVHMCLGFLILDIFVGSKLLQKNIKFS